jgi:predicted MFS family arabinose efflux permease
VANPLLPLRVVLDRNRGGAYLGMGLAAIGVFGVFIFLTFYMQRVLGFSPITTGVAFMPLNLSIVTTAMIVNTRLLARTGPRPLIPTGMVLNVISMLLLTRVAVDSGYAGSVLPSLILSGIGFGLIFAPTFSGASEGVEPKDAGIASAMVNTSQQVGGAVGTALLSTLVVSATTSFAEGKARTPGLMAQAAVHGYTVAFATSAGIFALGAVLTAALLRSGPPASTLARRAQEAEAAAVAAEEEAVPVAA